MGIWNKYEWGNKCWTMVILTIREKYKKEKAINLWLAAGGYFVGLQQQRVFTVERTFLAEIDTLSMAVWR